MSAGEFGEHTVTCGFVAVVDFVALVLDRHVVGGVRTYVNESVETSTVLNELKAHTVLLDGLAGQRKRSLIGVCRSPRLQGCFLGGISRALRLLDCVVGCVLLPRVKGADRAATITDRAETARAMRSTGFTPTNAKRSPFVLRRVECWKDRRIAAGIDWDFPGRISARERGGNDLALWPCNPGLHAADLAIMTLMEARSHVQHDTVVVPAGASANDVRGFAEGKARRHVSAGQQVAFVYVHGSRSVSEGDAQLEWRYSYQVIEGGAVSPPGQQRSELTKQSQQLG